MASSRTPGADRAARFAGHRSEAIRRADRRLGSIDTLNVAGRGSAAADHLRLRRVLAAHLFHPVFQPIVDLLAHEIVGFEALTRFHDGTPPEVRFAQADEAGLGRDFELATMRAALDQAARLPGDRFLSINVSPSLVLSGDRRLRELIGSSARPIVVELTEHASILDYGAVRSALFRVGAVTVAVDDVGAGYASLRHILELRPAYAKLDISLVRDIDHDDLRQSLAAGLQHFASRAGCRLVAEGVETGSQAETLSRLGIQFGQGYLFDRPESADWNLVGQTGVSGIPTPLR